MSFSTINRCANDQSFANRIAGCLAGEGQTNPLSVVGEVIWPVSAASDVEAAYASALAADNPDPGGDESVITDGMILAHVQAALAALP
jgi:hypothetical protein